MASNFLAEKLKHRFGIGTAALYHVLHIIKILNRAGASRAMLATARHLSLMGVRQTCISLTPSHGGEELVRAAGVRFLNGPSESRVLAEMAQSDIVRLEWWHSPAMAQFLRQPLPPVRLLLFLHVAGNQYPHPLTHEVFEQIDFCIAGCGYAARNGLLGQLPQRIRRQKLRTIMASCDEARMRSTAKKPHSGFNISYIGDLNTLKMHPGFLELCARAKIKEKRIVMRGKGSPQTLAMWRQKARDLGISNQCDIGGYAADIQAIFAKTDVFAYPLRIHPGAELVVQEAMHAGQTVVALPKGGLQDLIQHGETGLLPPDEAAFPGALEYLHRHPQERHRLGGNARRFALQNLGGVHQASALHALYQEILELPKRAHPAKPVALHGADLLCHSLGDMAKPFETSRHAGEGPERLEAEKTIAGLFLDDRVLAEYAATFPQDPHLQYWMGLSSSRHNQPEEAATYFAKARQMGMAPARIRLTQQAVTAEMETGSALGV